MTGRLQNQIAIVTGGGRGIGAATAALFAREGARVVIASRNAEQLKSVADTIAQESSGDRIHSFAADVSDEEEVEALFNETQAHFGSPNILINNAAVITVKPFEDFTVAEWDQMMAVNLRGPFL
ncbi:SDR family oxidoreductase, partial [bacterium]|nr:SDR family oxidoreductase [bacterium]